MNSPRKSLRTRLLLALASSGLALLLGTFAVREIAVRYASEASIRSSLEGRISTLEREACENGEDMPRREFRLRPGGTGLPDGFRPVPRPGDDRFGGPPDGRGRGPLGPRPGGGGFEGPGPDGRGPGPGRMGGGGPFGAPVRVFFYDAHFNPRPPGGPPVPEHVRKALRSGVEFVGGRDGGGFFGGMATPWPGGVCTYAVALMPTPPPLASFGSLILGALLLIGAPALVLWLALAKPVARIRALAEGVRGAAAGHYETSVPVSGDDEIAELATAFNEASSTVRAHVADVERREKALRDFVAHTTHDVALPLSVLLGHVSRLRETASTGEGKDAVKGIAQETQYIASLLANLEAVARLEADAALQERHPIDLSALVERVAARHRGVASSTGVDFNHSAPSNALWVEGDVTLIEQAVNNLVHNAIQYNTEGGHVALVLEEGDAKFRVRVSDDGSGVPVEALSRLGENRFRSEEARSRRPNGMGLGLSIARDVARRHNFVLSLGNRGEGGFEAILEGPLQSPPGKL